MKLATKYQIDSLRSRIIDILHDSWPQTFEQWLRLQSEEEIMRKTHNEQLNNTVDGKFLDDRLPEPASAVRFARDFDVPSVLPYAYYSLAGRHYMAEWYILRGDPKNRETLEATLLRTARWTVLEPIDLQIVLSLRERLVQDIDSIINMLKESEGLSTLHCYDPEECYTVSGGVWRHWLDNGLIDESKFILGSRNPNPLRTLQDLYNMYPSWKMCSFCTAALQRILRNKQQELWGNIPTVVQSTETSIRGASYKLPGTASADVAKRSGRTLRLTSVIRVGISVLSPTVSPQLC